MFRCKKCRANIGPGKSPVRIVLKSREKTYPARFKQGRDEEGRKETICFDPGGEGWEIVEEASYCESCAKKFEESR